MKTTHEFALFSPEFTKSITTNNKTVAITEPTTLHRLQHVLRLASGDSLVLFDHEQHALCTLESITKKQITLSFKQPQKNLTITPELIVIVPLLKREALDELIYNCRELGASGIYLVSTEKSSRSSMTAQEWERLERVSIASAEQSKNFSPCPFLNINKKIISLTELLAKEEFNKVGKQSIKLFASPDGVTLTSQLPTLEPTKRFIISFGPEGDLTDQEKATLKTNGFTFVKLGSTVLRAQQAATLLMGFIRSLV